MRTGFGQLFLESSFGPQKFLEPALGQPLLGLRIASQIGLPKGGGSGADEPMKHGIFFPLAAEATECPASGAEPESSCVSATQTESCPGAGAQQSA